MEIVSGRGCFGIARLGTWVPGEGVLASCTPPHHAVADPVVPALRAAKARLVPGSLPDQTARMTRARLLSPVPAELCGVCKAGV